MPKRHDRIERLDRAIADTEVDITEQVLRIVQSETLGRRTKPARRVLKTLYDLLMEYHRARDAIIEAQKLTGKSGHS